MWDSLRQLSAIQTSDQVIQKELASLAPKGDPEPFWTADHVLLMENGEYLIYRFRHGYNNGTLDHLFLAHGSDGRWYYSTYHFCNHMAGVMGMPKPISIADFASTYSAREFDGKSDVCLKRTHEP